MEILQDIKQLVENETKLNLQTKTRKKEYVFARAIYFRLCKEFTTYSLASIGSTVNKDHATVLHGLKIFREFQGLSNTFQSELTAYYNIVPKLKKISEELKAKNPETLLERLAKEKQDMINERDKSIEDYNTLKHKHNRMLKYFTRYQKNAYEKHKVV